MTHCNGHLADYIATRSSGAFRAIMERYFDLVYSTALRRMAGDSAAAQDVAQIVFFDLAGLAVKLPADVQLGGWLHRHTCFVASKQLRGERRRQHHETEKARMTEFQTSAGNFDEIAPSLDEAIDQLAEADRKAIMLRFFEQLEFAAVGQALSATEDAARMRVSRALDKLRGLLSRRGVVVPGAALAAAMSDRAIAKAPAGASARVAEMIFTGRSPIGPGSMRSDSSGLVRATPGLGAKLAVAGVGVPLLVGGALLVWTYAGKSAAIQPVATALSAPAAIAPATTAPSPMSFTVKVTGTRGTPFKGIIVTDGESTPVTGKIPYTVEVKGQVFKFAFQKTVAKGNIAIDVSHNGDSQGQANTPMDFAGVFATIRGSPRGDIEESMFTIITADSFAVIAGEEKKK